MKCEICGEDSAEVFVILAIKKPDGCLNTIACLECAEKSPAYCKKHQRPHLGFSEDDTTACAMCIEEMVAEKESEELNLFRRFREELPQDEKNRLLKWAEDSARFTLNSKGICTLRAIATKALRTKQSFEEVVERIISEKSVSYILPLGYPLVY